jgi:hypothetical protein
MFLVPDQPYGMPQVESCDHSGATSRSGSIPRTMAQHLERSVTNPESVVAPMAASDPRCMLGPLDRRNSVDRTAHAAEAGDLIVIAGHHVGEAERIGEILEVLGELPHESYRVRWDDDHESVFRPGSDATIKHSTRRPASRKAK